MLVDARVHENEREEECTRSREIRSSGSLTGVKRVEDASGRRGDAL